jgi:hypothetical protein
LRALAGATTIETTYLAFVACKTDDDFVQNTFTFAVCCVASLVI